MALRPNSSPSGPWRSSLAGMLLLRRRSCLILLCAGLMLGLPSCQRNVCPSVGNSTMDDPTKAKKQRKPQSGLFGGKGGPRAPR